MIIFTIIIFLGIIQGFFLGFTLLTIKRGNRKANLILGILIIVFSINISNVIFLNINAYDHFPYLIIITNPPVFLFGPLFFLLVKVITNNTYKIRIKHTLHSIPFIICTVYLLILYLGSMTAQAGALQPWVDQLTVISKILSSFVFFHIVIYISIIFNVISDYERKIKNSYASIDKKNIKWIKTFGKEFSLVVAVSIILTVFVFTTYGRSVAPYAGNIIALMVAFFIYKAGYDGLRNMEIFMADAHMVQRKKYTQSTLRPDQAAEYEKRLLSVMSIKKPYLSNNLSIQDLAEECGIPAYHLSQIINEQFNQNFFDFINRYRIEEAKKLLTDSVKKHYTILAVAYEVGFNSKSAFNKAFKKYTHETPSQFRDQ
ncbi:MAG: helix-turn-helix transcriptional regulator [bacterium]